MVVSFTANIGLAKPDESEVAENWVNTQQLADDNNVIITAEMNVPLVSYTPTVIAQTTPPNLGSGAVLRGQYQDFQGFIFGNFHIIFVDPGVAAGSGEYGISLPFQADGSFHAAGTALNSGVGSFSCLGEGYIRDDSAVNGCGTVALELVTISTTSYVRLVTEAIAGKSSRVVRDTVPFTVATADSMAGNFFYKRA